MRQNAYAVSRLKLDLSFFKSLKAENMDGQKNPKSRFLFRFVSVTCVGRSKTMDELLLRRRRRRRRHRR